MKSRYPIFIASKGRWNQRHTMKALDRMSQPYLVIVEEQEFAHYAEVIPEERLLILPSRYLDEYDTFDDLGDTKSKGPGAARNFAWDMAVSYGSASGRHWIMDDNIYYFVRATYNLNAVSHSAAIFAAAEDFVDRYENIAIAGFNYVKFCQAKTIFPPYVLNTRIYSCLLIRNDLPYRWRGRYNEDTDLSLRALKDGWCTLNFQAFLADKATTSRMKGGNTKEFYEREGNAGQVRDARTNAPRRGESSLALQPMASSRRLQPIQTQSAKAAAQRRDTKWDQQLRHDFGAPRIERAHQLC